MFELDEIEVSEADHQDVIAVETIQWFINGLGTVNTLGIRCSQLLRDTIKLFSLMSCQNYFIDVSTSGDEIVAFSVAGMTLTQWKEGDKLTWRFSIYDGELKFIRI